jgi:hypothetical protein
LKWVNNFTQSNWAEGRVYKGDGWLERYQGKYSNKKEKNMNWITSRIKEKSSQGGVALIAMGLVVIFLGGFVNIAAYAAIAYGAYQLLSEG